MAFFTNKTDATWTPPAGMTELYDDPNHKEGLTSNMLAYYVQPVKGETGAKTAVASKQEAWVAQILAVQGNNAGTESARIINTRASTAAGQEATLVDELPGEIHAYPNPVHDVVNIIIKGITTQPAASDVMIVDGMGRIYPVEATWHSDSNRMEVDFSDMKAGMYIINVRTMAGTKSLKVFKRIN